MVEFVETPGGMERRNEGVGLFTLAALATLLAQQQFVPQSVPQAQPQRAALSAACTLAASAASQVISKTPHMPMTARFVSPL